MRREEAESLVYTVEGGEWRESSSNKQLQQQEKVSKQTSTLSNLGQKRAAVVCVCVPLSSLDDTLSPPLPQVTRHACTYSGRIENCFPLSAGFLYSARPPSYGQPTPMYPMP